MYSSKSVIITKYTLTYTLVIKTKMWEIILTISY